MTTATPPPIPPPPIPPGPPPVPEHPRRWIVAVVAMIAAWLVGSLVVTMVRGTTSISVTSPSPDGLSAHDVSTIAEVNVQLAAFNAAALPVYADYIDPEVTARAWIRRADRRLDDMQAAQRSMLASAMTLENAGVRDSVTRLSRVVGRQVDAVTDIRNAAHDHDMDAERAAQASLRSANAERAERWQELVALLLFLGVAPPS